MLALTAGAALGLQDCMDRRPAPEYRKFKSTAVDRAIKTVSSKMSDRDLSCIFSNALPNTLDTTVLLYEPVSKELPTGDAFIITGDIPAMWLRDSTNQVLPYMRFLSEDPSLAGMIAGLMHRQATQVVADPWANAHSIESVSGPSPHTADQTTYPNFGPSRSDAMLPGIYERKYELDSLMAFLKLSRSYYDATGDARPFQEDPSWRRAVDQVLWVVSLMQQSTLESAAAPAGATYQFQREALEPTDTLLHGVGVPGAETGMARSAFRPSDDATTFPFLVPANAMAVVELRHTARVLRKTAAKNDTTADAAADLAEKLADAIDDGIKRYARMTHPRAGDVLAYEVDGYGNYYFADDANIPSLLSLPYLGYTNSDDPLYKRTRNGVLSNANPWFFKGQFQGIGGPHIGINMIWPMALTMQALTSNNDTEILSCLDALKASAAGTGLMHESFNVNDTGSYTRPWFAWANSLFGDLILTLAEQKPHLLW